MKQQRNSKSLFEILLVIGAILLIPLFFAIGSQAAQGTETTPTVVLWPSPSPIGAAAQVVVASPTAIPPTPVARGKQPPACTFPLAQIKPVESKPENYTFSEPHVVLTASEGNPLNVAEWLPDNQQVLITEGLRNQYVDNNNTAPQQSISLYNLETGKLKVYAVRTEVSEPPVWQPELNRVVYPALNFTSLDKLKGIRIFTRQLKVSDGNPDDTQLLADNLRFPFVIQPGKNEILYFTDKKMSKLDKSLKKLSLASFDSDQWDYAKERRDNKPVSYQMVWQPGTSFVFLYSESGYSLQGGYAFMLNTTNGNVCELNLGGQINRFPRWSSDGRFLAFARATSYTEFSNTVDLAVLDSITGDLRTLDVVPPNVKGQHYVTDLTWTPDNLHLLVFADIPSTYDNFKTMHHKLYFVDFTTGQSAPLFPEFKSFFAYGIPGMNNFAWSPDGLKLLMRCPSLKGRTTDRFCLISVQRTKP